MAAAILGIITAAAGIGTSVAGGIMSGRAAKRIGEANADDILATALSNAESAEFQAANILEATQIAERQNRYQNSIILARNKAAVGASGLAFQGSPLDVAAENARQAEIQALEIRRGGQIQLDALRRQEQADIEHATRQAEVARLGGQASATAANYGAAGSAIAGGYQIGKDIIDLAHTKPS